MPKFKWIYSLPVICFLLFATGMKPADKDAVHWISFQELNERYEKDPKPIIIDVYTDWCGWCKQMDRTTYRNEKLVDYVNEKFYAVKFNAESTDTIRFNQKQYIYNATMRINELAMYLTFNRLEFPHTIFLSSPGAQPAPLSGYMKPEEIEAPMKFFGEKASDDQTFVEFSKKMKKEWK